MNRGRLEVGTTVEGDATLLRLAGPIDETFVGFEPLRTPQVVLELSGLTRITSYGVRQWIKARDQLASAARHLYYVNCPPCFVDQLNMVMNFGGAGQVVSAFAPFSCNACQREQRVLVDVLRRHEELVAGPLRVEPCSQCRAAMEMDELPDTFFAFVRSAGARSLGGAAATILASQQLYQSSSPARDPVEATDAKLSVLKLVHDQVTYFRLGGAIDKRFRARSLLEGIEGEVVLDLRDVTAMPEEGRPEWDRLRAGLAERARLVTLVDVPPPILNALQAGLSLAGGVVYSIVAPHQCTGCGKTALTSLPLARTGGAAADRTCKACGGITKFAGDAAHLQLAKRLPGEPILATTREMIERREDLLSRARIDAEAAPHALIRSGVVLGKYEIVRAISVGGMAEVFLAVQRGIGGFEKPVALKRIRRSVLERRHFAVEHFLDEAKIAATLSHPNIAQIYDVAEEDGVLYLAMEYVHGKDLRVLAKRRREKSVSMPLGAALFVAQEIAKALHHAYTAKDLSGRQMKAIHRDVTPHNVVCGFDGTIKLVDFGVAVSATTGKREPTHIAGKQSYMAPEQRAGQPLDARSDLFGLGVVLYELLADERPFSPAEDPTTAKLVPVTSRRSDLPPGIDVLLGKLLAPSPQARFADGQQVAEAIARLAAGVGIDVSGTWIKATLPTLFPRGLEEAGFDPDGALHHTMQTPRSDSFSLSPGADPNRLRKLPPLASAARPGDREEATSPPAAPLVSPALPLATTTTPAPTLAPPPPALPRVWWILALLLALALGGFLWMKF